jgi:hypothetical protein
MPSTSEIHKRLTSLHPREENRESEGLSGDDCAARFETGVSDPAIEKDVLQPVASPTLLELVELILKDRPRLERVIRDPSLAVELIPRFLAVSLVGFTLFGVVMALVIHALGVRLQLASMKSVLEGTAAGLIQFEPLVSRSATGIFHTVTAGLRLVLAYDLGLIAAAGICLPSLYFYGLLAGVPMSMARVTVHTVKSLSTTAVALVGILPIYMAFSLGAAIFHAPPVVTESVLWLGLVLPFVAGLFGVNSLYTGFTGLTDSLPPERRWRRACFLRRLVVSWSVCYSAVTPVMIFTLWEYFSRTQG